MVDGDNILHQQNDHHHHFKRKTNDNGAEDDVQQPDAAHPGIAAGPVVRLDIKQLQHTVKDNEGRGENVERLQHLFHHKEPEVAKVMQEFAEGTLVLTPFFRHDEDECQHRCGNTENYRDDQENHLLHGILSFFCGM